MKKSLHTLLVVVFAGLTFNVHALCVNPDGSLDDASLSDWEGSVEMLQACDKSAAKAASNVTQKSSKPNQQDPGSTQAAATGKVYDKSILIKGDCRDGDSKGQADADTRPVCDI